jgi:hypothetical protein
MVDYDQSAYGHSHYGPLQSYHCCFNEGKQAGANWQPIVGVFSSRAVCVSRQYRFEQGLWDGPALTESKETGS